MTRELKGRHVLAIAIGAFAIVIGANLAMLFAATGSFPGLVVENSYVASQNWNERAAAQEALGWTSEIGYANGEIRIVLTDADGRPVTGTELAVTVGRATTEAEDRVLQVRGTAGTYVARADLAPGRWRIEVAAVAGPAWQKTAHLDVREP